MRAKYFAACLWLLAACGNQANKDKPTNTKTDAANPSDSKPSDNVPSSTPTTSAATTSAPAPVASDWPPAGYQVAATPPLAPGSTTPGWVELPSLATHKAMEAVSPQKPLLNGAFDEKGAFYTDGKGELTRKDCPPDKGMYLDLETVKLNPTLPAPTPTVRLLFLCEGKEFVDGKEGVLIAK